LTSGRPEDRVVIERFMPNGRLEQMPAKRGRRLVVLDQVARMFEPGHRYPEREVNDVLRTVWPDYAALRRYLVDEGFLDRADGVYWRAGGTVET
jgi:hypothetical protein